MCYIVAKPTLGETAFAGYHLARYKRHKVKLQNEKRDILGVPEEQCFK